MKQKKYIIGIDGGGTKTHAIITGSGGKLLAEHFGGEFKVYAVKTARLIPGIW